MFEVKFFSRKADCFFRSNRFLLNDADRSRVASSNLRMNRPNDLVLPTLGLLACVLGLALMVWNGKVFTETKPTSPVVQREPARSGLTTEQEDERLLRDPAFPFREVYRALAHRQPDEITALAHKLKDLPRGPATDAKVAAFFKAWATLDAAGAFAEAKSLPAHLRMAALEAVLDGTDASMAGALVPWIKQLPEDVFSGNEKTGLLSQGVSKWSRIDPLAAARFLEADGSTGMSFFTVWSDVASNWAALDPAAAIAWAKEKKRPGPNFALSGAVAGWWENDPSAAEAYVQSHLTTLQDWQLAGTLASNIFRDDPARARRWVSQLPNDDARRQANSSLAISWAFDDPAAAVKWASSLPVGDGGTALAEAVGLWAGEDASAAGEWLGQYDGAGRDQAVQNFSLNVATKDPAAAMTWAGAISDPRLRTSAQEQLARDWLRRDPSAATNWIQNSSLSAEDKTRLLSAPPGP